MASITFEIEIELSGTVVPYRPATGPTYDSGGDPPDGGFAEDVEIEGLGIVERVRPPAHERGSHEWIWQTKSLLNGVALKSPDIQRLFSNILALKDAEAQEAIMEDEA